MSWQDEPSATRRRILKAGLVAGTLIAGVGQGRPAAGQHATVYFPETGQTVGGAFWEFWRARGALDSFGFPITREFEQLGVRQQYFQRMRFERWPGSDSIVLPLLGDEAAQGRPPAPAPDGPLPGQVRYFPETGHYVTDAILAFFQARGGLETFGYPIAEPVGDAAFVQQWFQRARLEWRAGTGVQVGLVGQELAQRYGVDTTPAPRPEGVPDWTDVFFAPPAASPALPEPPSPPPETDVRAFARQRTGYDLPVQPGERWIQVSLAQQRIWAWHGTQVVLTDLISSGRAGRGTPAGAYRILRRVFNETMDSRSIGIPRGHPEFYYLQNVLYTQYYTPVGHAIHYAWWHNNFGTPQSAGCINLRYSTAEFFWNWANIGTRILVH